MLPSSRRTSTRTPGTGEPAERSRLAHQAHLGRLLQDRLLCHRIREAMGNDPFTGPTLFGIVEVDETLVGGKTKGKGRASRATRPPGPSSGAETSASSASLT